MLVMPFARRHMALPALQSVNLHPRKPLITSLFPRGPTLEHHQMRAASGRRRGNLPIWGGALCGSRNQTTPLHRVRLLTS